MGLRIWLPLNGNLENKGLSDITVTSTNTSIETNGKIGSCYSFNGSNSSLLISNAPIIQEWDESTVCFWLKNAPTGKTQCIINHRTVTGKGLAIFLISSKIRIDTDNSMTSFDYAYNFTNWTHIAIVSKTGERQLYVNGELTEIKSVTGTVVYQSSGTYASIGGSSTNTTTINSNWLQGLLNDFRLYDEALSPMQIKLISQGLVAHYLLNNNGGGNNNLALNSHNLNITATKNNKNISKRETNTNVVQLREDGFYEAKVTKSFGGVSIYANSLNLQIGDKITFSFYTYINGSSKTVSFYPMMYNSSGTRDTSSSLPVSVDGGTYTTVNAKQIGQFDNTSPKKHYVVFEWNNAMKSILDNGGKIELTIQIHGTWQDGDYGCIFAPKLEHGDKPTPWCPNSADSLATQLGYNNNIEYDVSGYCNNGTKYNITDYTSDTPRYSVATKFNGSSCIKNNNFNLSGKIWSVSCWYYKSENPTEYEGLFCLSKNSGSDADKKIAAMLNTRRIWYKGESGSLSISKLKIAEWTLLTMTCDGTVVKIYENGTLIGSYNAGNEILDANDLVIGARASSTDAESTSVYFTGQISDFRIYATTLSESDIQSLYNNSAFLDSSGNIYATEYTES